MVLLPGRRNKRHIEEVDTDEEEATTEAAYETFSFLWTIKKYANFCIEERIVSPGFLGGTESQHQWHLECNRVYMHTNPNTWAIHLFLDKLNDNNDTIFETIYKKARDVLLGDPELIKARFKLSILSSTGEEVKVSEMKNWGIFSEKRNMRVALGFNRQETDQIGEDLKIRCRIELKSDLVHKGVNHRMARIEERQVPRLRNRNARR